MSDQDKNLTCSHHSQYHFTLRAKEHIGRAEPSHPSSTRSRAGDELFRRPTQHVRAH